MPAVAVAMPVVAATAVAAAAAAMPAAAAAAAAGIAGRKELGTDPWKMKLNLNYHPSGFY